MLDNARHHIIGTGRWGTWLARRLQATGHDVATVRNRTDASAKTLAKELAVAYASTFVDHTEFLAGDIVWCCVSDADIAKLLEVLKAIPTSINVVHCSGTSPLPSSKNSGVFWPIQSITAGTEPDWSNLPIVVQASSSAFAKTLHKIASEVSELPPKLVNSDDDRMRLHLAAVMTQNFSNLLWTLTEEVLAKANLDYKDLLPLAQNHLEKLAKRAPKTLQTGPAKRGDQNTISTHLDLLSNHPDAAEIYTLLSNQIAKKED